MSPAFWKNRKVFVTGHTGFKGSWLCLMLASLGARVHGYALQPPTDPNLYSLARVGDLVESSLGDVRDLAALEKCMRGFEPDIVFHMAAQSVVLASYEDPTDTYSTNVMGTVNVLESVRRSNRACVVVNVTTDKCYDNKGWVWGYRETDELGGHDPYSNSKACAELVGQCYRDSFFPTARFAEHGVALASARAGNVVGGGDWTFRQLVPETIAAFVRRESVNLRHPDAVRPWQHVLDCLGGYMHLAEALANDGPAHAGGWNFGPVDSDTRTVSQVVDALATDWDIERPWFQDRAVHAPEAQQLRLDVNKAASLLGWGCRLPIDEALKWVSSWYREYHAGTDALRLCNEQISQYMKRMEALQP